MIVVPRSNGLLESPQRLPPHPFTAGGRRDFDALLQPKPDVFPGRLLICYTTIWSSTAGGVDSLQRFWRNVVQLKRVNEWLFTYQRCRVSGAADLLVPAWNFGSDTWWAPKARQAGRRASPESLALFTGMMIGRRAVGFLERLRACLGGAAMAFADTGAQVPPPRPQTA